MEETKVYCNMCNGEDEASICIWCHINKLEKQAYEIKERNKNLIHSFEKKLISIEGLKQGILK